MADTPWESRSFRTLATCLALVVAGCGAAASPPPVTGTAEPASFTIGPAAVDTVGGWLPDGRTLSPVDTSNPIVGWLEPSLLEAVQDAARAAAAEGIDMRITSGWRSRGFQQRLFDGAVRNFGNVDAATEFVAAPETSKHVDGKAVDIAPIEADNWLIRHGSRFGLCQIYANEIWHFELVADNGRCPPLKPNAAAG
ncbi:M15 family metallopeptidase [Mycolicibacterium sp. XJ1819]